MYIHVYIYTYIRSLKKCILMVVYSLMVYGHAASYARGVRADDEPDTRPTIGEEGSTLWLTTTKRRPT